MKCCKPAKNPISRDRKDDMVIGSFFNDAHGRSVVIGFGNPGGGQSDEPTIADCPQPDGPGAHPVTAVNGIFTDECGAAMNAAFTPATTLGIEYVVTTDGNTISVTASAQEGYTLTNPDWTQTYTDMLVACDTPAPAPCTVSDQTFRTTWEFEGTNPMTGAYPEGVEGTYTFKTDGLHLSTPNKESYVYGMVSAGNTALKDISAMSYKTLREATSTGAAYLVPGYIIYVDLDGDTATTEDQTYLFYEPVYNGMVQTGVWQTWDVLSGGASTWWSFDLSGGNPTLTWSSILSEYPNAVALAYGFNQGTSNQGTNSAVQDIVFDCATTSFTAGAVLGDNDTPTTPGGMGGGSTAQAPAPVVKTPAVLEDTGANIALPVVVSAGLLIAALVMTFGMKVGKAITAGWTSLSQATFVVPTA